MRHLVRVLMLCGVLAPAAAFGQTAFTYQGVLSDSGRPSEGLHDMRFRLFDAESGGGEVATALCADDVTIVGGLFAVELDFGNAFTDVQDRFLEIEVRADSGAPCTSGGGFDVLAPRTRLTRTPFAHHALNARTALAAETADNASALGGQPSSFYTSAASLASGTLSDARLSANIPRLNANAVFTGAVTLNNPSNVISGSGGGLTGLNASNLTSGTVPGQALFGEYPNALTFSNFNNVLVGEGSAVRALNASNFASGTLSIARGGTGSNGFNAQTGQVLKFNGSAFTPQNEVAYFAGSGLTLTSNTFSIQPGQITGAMIAAATITGVNISPNSLGAADIGPNAITSSELALDAGSLARVTNSVMTMSGVNVAIGGAPDTNRLRVVGNLGVTGALAADTITISPVQRIYPVLAVDIMQTGGANLSLDCESVITSNGATAAAALRLPDGAIITGIDVRFALPDVGVTETMTARLRRRTATGTPGSTVLATITRTATNEPAVQTRSATGLAVPVDNDLFIYLLELDTDTDGVIPEPEFFNAKVYYTVTQPLP